MDVRFYPAPPSSVGSLRNTATSQDVRSVRIFHQLLCPSTMQPDHTGASNRLHQPFQMIDSYVEYNEVNSSGLPDVLDITEACQLCGWALNGDCYISSHGKSAVSPVSYHYANDGQFNFSWSEGEFLIRVRHSTQDGEKDVKAGREEGRESLMCAGLSANLGRMSAADAHVFHYVQICSRYSAADRGVRLYSSLPMRPNPDGKRLPSTGFDGDNMYMNENNHEFLPPNQ
ncbi:hypothetical protein E3U43_003341, partial [Larimichthys crocea]